MQRVLAIWLLTLYAFSVSPDVIADAFNISNKVTIKKHCKKQKDVGAESESLPTTISADENELISLPVINAICVIATTPHFATHSIELIPYSDTSNSLKVPEAYHSPSLLRDPFPPKA